MKFNNLRNYSENSILNSTIRVGDLINRAKEKGLKAIALTDKTAYGMVQFFMKCQESEIKPLYGFNVKSLKNSEGGFEHNILIYPKSEKGKVNNFLIVSDNNTEHLKNGIVDYIELNETEKLEDVIVIVDYNTYIKYREQYEALPIPKEDLIIEIQPRNEEENFIKAKELVGINRIIVTSPTFYLDKVAYREEEEITTSDGEIHKQINFELYGSDVMKVMKSIETGQEIGDIEQNFNNLHFKSDKEIREQFSYINDEDYNTILVNIENIIDRINFHLDLYNPQIPIFEMEGEIKDFYNSVKDRFGDMHADEWLLRYFTYSNLEYRYKIHLTEEEILDFIYKTHSPKLEKKLSEYELSELEAISLTHFSETKKEKIKTFTEEQIKLIERIENELFIIHQMGYDAYFLIVSDYIQWAKNNGVIVGAGRGSAAGSIVAYLSKITDIDPIKYDLLFLRFLNPYRVSMPDVDTDFSDRDAVIAYCVRKYGVNNVCPIITFGKLSAKTTLKGVGKGKGFNFSEMNRLTNYITSKEATGGKSLEYIYENNDKFREEIDKSSEYKELFKTAQQLEDFKCQTGRHACAVIIAPKPVTNFFPVQYPMDKTGEIKERNNYITQLEGGDLEAQGLLKMDFLGLNNLNIISNALKLIEKNHGKKIDILNIDVEDQEVYKKIFQTGNTTNIFQFESPGMKKHLKNLEPNTFEDLIAMVSLYRPGPMQFIDTYIAVKKGLQEPKYKDPALKDLLDITNSVCIYQEQIMRMSQVLAGYSLGEADILRRAIGKKKKKIILEQREIFCKKGEALGRNYDIMGEIYDDIVLPAAEYSFNKSHAACYAFIAFQTAYLKTYYPVEFAVGNLMTDNGKDLVRMEISIEDAINNNLIVKPLDINTSDFEYKVINDKTLEMGFKGIKGLGESLKPIIEERDKNGKYTDFNNFYYRNYSILTKSVLENLIKSGALHNLIEANLGLSNSAYLTKKLKDKITRAKNKDTKKKEKEVEQNNLFDIFDTEVKAIDNNEVDELKYLEENFPIEMKEVEFPLNNLDLSLLEDSVIGMSLRYHPLDGIYEYLNAQVKSYNNKIIYSTQATKTLSMDDKKVKLFGILKSVEEKKTSSGELMCTIKLLGHDFLLNGRLNKVLYYNNIGKLKNSVNTLVCVEGTFNANAYGVSISVNSIEYKDINLTTKVAKMNNFYNEDKKCSWKKIFAYTNRDLKIVEPIYIEFTKTLLKTERIKEIIEELKEFFIKYNDSFGQYEIFYKVEGHPETTKPQGFKIQKDKIETIKNKINTLSGVKLQMF